MSRRRQPRFPVRGRDKPVATATSVGAWLPSRGRGRRLTGVWGHTRVSQDIGLGAWRLRMRATTRRDPTRIGVGVDYDTRLCGRASPP